MNRGLLLRRLELPHSAAVIRSPAGLWAGARPNPLPLGVVFDPYRAYQFRNRRAQHVSTARCAITRRAEASCRSAWRLIVDDFSHVLTCASLDFGKHIDLPDDRRGVPKDSNLSWPEWREKNKRYNNERGGRTIQIERKPGVYCLHDRRSRT